MEYVRGVALGLDGAGWQAPLEALYLFVMGRVYG